VGTFLPCGPGEQSFDDFIHQPQLPVQTQSFHSLCTRKKIPNLSKNLWIYFFPGIFVPQTAGPAALQNGRGRGWKGILQTGFTAAQPRFDRQGRRAAPSGLGPSGARQDRSSPREDPAAVSIFSEMVTNGVEAVPPGFTAGAGDKR